MRDGTPRFAAVSAWRSVDRELQEPRRSCRRSRLDPPRGMWAHHAGEIIGVPEHGPFDVSDGRRDGAGFVRGIGAAGLEPADGLRYGGHWIDAAHRYRVADHDDIR